MRDMRTRDEREAEFWASEFRNCFVFAVACIFGLLAFQFLWSA